MNKKIFTMFIVISLLLVNVFPTFATQNIKEYEKLVGFKYNITGNEEIVNQNYILFAKYDFDTNGDIDLQIKTNVSELKDLNYFKLVPKAENIYGYKSNDGYEVLLELNNNELLLNILIDSENYLFSKTSRFDIVKSYFNQEVNDISPITMSISTESIDQNVITQDSTSKIFFQGVYNAPNDYISVRVNTNNTEVLPTHVTRLKVLNGSVTGNNVLIKSITPFNMVNTNGELFIDFLYYLAGLKSIFLPTFSDPADAGWSDTAFFFISDGMWEDYNSLNYISDSTENGMAFKVNVGAATIPTGIHGDVTVTYYSSLMGYLSYLGDF